MPSDREKIEFWLKKQVLVKELIRQNDLINATLDWTIKRIDQKFLELGQAIKDNNYSKVEECRTQILDLIAKSNREDKNIELCLSQQKKAIEDEKKVLLPNSGAKK